MKELKLDIDLTVTDLFLFSMRHVYHGASGICGLVISFGSLLLCFCRFRYLDRMTIAALLIIGALFTVVQPLLLYYKSWMQRLQSKDINAPLQYHITEEGITVVRGDQEAMVRWYEIRRMVCGKKALYLYMSPVRAFIFPRSQCGEAYETLVKITREMIEKYKDFEPEVEEDGEPDD